MNKKGHLPMYGADPLYGAVVLLTAAGVALT